MSGACWHCQDTNACGCAFCLIETIDGRKDGPCQQCVSRAFIERHRHVLDKFSTTDRDNWHRKPASDGNKAIMTFKPFIGLK